MLQGNYARTLQAAHQMAAGHSMMAANPRQQFLPPAWLVHKAFGRWQALLAESAPSADRLYLNAAWRYFRGSSFAGLGDFGKADSELQALSGMARDPALKDIFSGANSASSLASMLTSALTGEIALRRGRHAEAVTAFEQAVDAQDALHYDEPPNWLQPMRLYLGAALLKAGRAKDAEAVYREELHDLHENGWALFGLWQSVTAQGKNAEAQEMRKRFD